MKTNYSTFDLITLKDTIRDMFPALKNKDFRIWLDKTKCMLQCIVDKEFYGHTFEVDIDNKKLIIKP